MADEVFDFHLTGSGAPKEVFDFHLKGFTIDTGFDFHLTGEGKEKPWTEIGIYVWNAVTDTSLYWSVVPGDYNGARILILTGYKEVKIVGVDGWWEDYPTGSTRYRSCLGFKTSVDFEDVGWGSSTSYIPAYGTINQAEAERLWQGAFAELTLGTDFKLGFGFQDQVDPPEPNTGQLRFKVYAR